MSEFDWIARYFAPIAKSVGAAGLTDDVAKLSSGNRIITTDALVESVHFLPTDPIETVARKLVRVNVSDIVSKGARPSEALLTLGWPPIRLEDDLKSFAAAFQDELASWGIGLLGGDTVTSPDRLFLSLTLTGTLPEGREPVRRSGALVGDTVWLSGEMGWGGLGLTAARAGEEGAAAARYRVPQIPSISLADTILAHATASMDISDGLIADLQKLLSASQCGAGIDLETIPLAAPIDRGVLGSVLAAITAGDDYQCVFTALPESTETLMQEHRDLTSIGTISAGADLQLMWKGQPIPLPECAGYEHG